MTTAIIARPLERDALIEVDRHSGVTIRGVVTEVGDWHPSCAGSPMRWITFRDASGLTQTVADSPSRDNQIRVLA